MIPGVILVCAGILAVWRPVETHPLTGVVLAVAFVVLIPWVWERTSANGARRSAGWTALWLVFLVVGQAGGWDRSEALAQAFLAGAVMAAIWVASRHSPEDWMIDVFALGLIGLAIWGLWQSLGGLDDLRVLIEGLPEHLRAGALARIDRGRAFASLLLPSHLAVVLATVLPILMVRINRDARGIFSALLSPWVWWAWWQRDLRLAFFWPLARAPWFSLHYDGDTSIGHLVWVLSQSRSSLPFGRMSFA